MGNKNKGLAIVLLMVPVLLLLAAGVATYLSVLEKRVPVYAPTQEEYQADYIKSMKILDVYVDAEAIEEKKKAGCDVYLLGDVGGILTETLAKRLEIYHAIEQNDTISIGEILSLYQQYDAVYAEKFREVIAYHKSGDLSYYDRGMRIALQLYRQAEGDNVLAGKEYEELSLGEWRELLTYTLTHPNMEEAEKVSAYSTLLSDCGIIEDYWVGEFENRKLVIRLVTHEEKEETGD